MSDDRIPVIVGVGEIVDRPADPVHGLEPLALMAVALERASEDAGGGLLMALDSLDVVNLTSWRYADASGQLSHRLGITPRRAVYGPLGGESPVRYLHEAALRIARGESEVAAICGAEAQSTVNKAKRAGGSLPWTPFSLEGPLSGLDFGEDFLRPQAITLGVAQPITVYPFYETASATRWGQTPREALAESGNLWADFSTVAASNPFAWSRQRFSREEIITPSADNRMIAWPYTKRMVANPMVNQGAAVLIMSLARARAAGIPTDRIVYIWGGAGAHEPRDYMDRDTYCQSHAQAAVLEAAMTIAGGQAFEALELYSCFPCVPKMARRVLGLGADVPLTVTGGLSFFGAPLNNYMTHAACAMVRSLRRGKTLGLLYGQGEFVTKHQGLVLSSSAPERPIQTFSPSVQAEADRRRGAVPPFQADFRGTASLETFTILYNRDGSVQHGVVILRTADGGRTIAPVPAGDQQTLERLVNFDQSPIGMAGILQSNADGIAEWRAGA
jgi:acetyl-CoA C-acetyltransferase